MAQVPSHTHTFTFDIPSASSAEVAAGTSDSKAVTPLALAGAGDTFLSLLGGGATGIDVFQSVTPADARTVLELGTASTSATGDFATAAQGTLADTAVQPADLATVATTGQYTDIVGTPTLGTAAAQDSTAFATAAQGLLADTAVQPGDGEAVPAGGTTGQVLAKASATDGDTFWTIAGQGDIISTNNGSDFADKSEVRANLAIGLTTSEIASRNIPATIQSFVTSGYSEPGDGGGALYKAVATEPTHAGKVQSANGRWWEYAENEINIRAFGAKGDGATIDTTAVLSAQAYAQLSLKPVVWGRGRFIVDETIEFPAGVEQEGAGGGEWLAWSAALPKEPAPTELIFVGTGARVHVQKLVTDMRTSGGVITNPSSIDANDGEYKLTSFMNDDGTLRQFSCAVKTEQSGRGSRVRGMRIVLNHPGPSETYGIGGYNDETETGLGDDWDVGFWNQCGQGLICEDVQVVGYWRMYGGLQTAVLDNDEATSGGGLTGSEYSRYVQCNFQGAVGFGIRGGDSYRVVEVGADYVGVEDVPNLPFKDAPTGRLRVGSSQSGSSVREYTAVTVVGGVCRLTLTGGTSGISVGHMVVANVYGFGLSNSVMVDSEVTNLSHASGVRATQLATPFEKPSAALEVSGSYIRGFDFRGTKFLGVDDVLWHLHDCQDITFDGQAIVEAKPDSITGTMGGRIIASPTPSLNTRVPNPMGNTSNLRIGFGASVDANRNDFRPYTPTAAPDRFSDPSDAGLFFPQGVRWDDLWFPMDRSNTVIQAPATGAVILKDKDGVNRIVVQETGAELRDQNNNPRVSVDDNGDNVEISNTTGTLRLNASAFAPTSPGALSLGSFGNYFDKVIAGAFRPGTSGQPVWTARVGSPEGAISGAVGSLCTRTDGASGSTLYVKTSGTGNTGWEATA